MITKNEIKKITKTETRTVEIVRKGICEATKLTEDIRNRKPSILVVEDEKVCAKLLVRCLRKYGLDVDCSYNGKEALDLVADDESKYSMVLTDISMPVMDGREMIAKLRQLAYNNSIIAITGDALSEDVQAVMHVGANEVLGKPVKSTYCITSC